MNGESVTQEWFWKLPRYICHSFFYTCLVLLYPVWRVGVCGLAYAASKVAGLTVQRWNTAAWNLRHLGRGDALPFSWPIICLASQHCRGRRRNVTSHSTTFANDGHWVSFPRKFRRASEIFVRLYIYFRSRISGMTHQKWAGHVRQWLLLSFFCRLFWNFTYLHNRSPFDFTIWDHVAWNWHRFATRVYNVWSVYFHLYNQPLWFTRLFYRRNEMSD